MKKDNLRKGRRMGSSTPQERAQQKIPSARNRCLAFYKDKYLEPMFGSVGQARTNAAMLFMPIATTSSRTLQKTHYWPPVC